METAAKFETDISDVTTSVYPAWQNINMDTQPRFPQTCPRPEPDRFLTPTTPAPRRFVFPAKRGVAPRNPNSTASGRRRRGRGPLRPSSVVCSVHFSIAAPLSVSLSWRRRLGERRRDSPRLPWRVLRRRQVPTRYALPFSPLPAVRNGASQSLM